MGAIAGCAESADIEVSEESAFPAPDFGKVASWTHDSADDNGVDIANLLKEGILDKTGRLSLNGDELCFESTSCPEPE